MPKRKDLHALLVSALGASNVYYQPPGSTKLTYPCIIYSLDAQDDKYADNRKFIKHDRYSVTLITKDPDSNSTREQIEDIAYSSFDRHYTSDNLHHFVYTIYY